ncbi:lyase family protein [Pseudonocardia benzenivorans]
MPDTGIGMLAPLLGSDRVARTVDAVAWLTALIDVEVALSHAAAAHGLVDAAAVAHVERAAAALRADLDPAVLAGEAVEGGNPVIPLARRLRAAAGLGAPAVHPGATSQDVMDTALVLLVRTAADVIGDDLAACADAAAALAAAHRDTPAIARTLGQQALPTTFGLVAAGWCAGLDRARVQLGSVVAALPVQFGGSAGTLAASYPHGPAVADALADRLGLPRQDVPWHTERTRIGELAAALGVAAGACARWRPTSCCCRRPRSARWPRPRRGLVVHAAQAQPDRGDHRAGLGAPRPGARRDAARRVRPRAPARSRSLARGVARADRPAARHRRGRRPAAGVARRAGRPPRGHGAQPRADLAGPDAEPRGDLVDRVLARRP